MLTAGFVPLTYAPTFDPTYAPTFDPTHAPTFDPTHAPTFDPTHAPTFDPTHAPTFDPTAVPTATCMKQSRCVRPKPKACSALKRTQRDKKSKRHA